jgi:hypothetical protein
VPDRGIPIKKHLGEYAKRRLGVFEEKARSRTKLCSHIALPTTYDAWLERAERIEREFQKAGFGVSKTWIRPIPIATWCDERNISPDQVARLIFVNEAVRDLLESRQH